MNSLEYRLDVERMAKKLAETRQKKKEIYKELKELEISYKEVLDKLTPTQ
jgi:predicted nuclease with TOPRIM domain